jgi:hypothetical protein
MLLCYFSKDKSFSENDETSWKRFGVEEYSEELKCILMDSFPQNSSCSNNVKKNVWNLTDLYEIFNNKCKKISLVVHFAESTYEGDLVCISKIISHMNKNVYNYAMFHDI